MTIDWVAVATIAAPIIALFVGIWVNRHFESRPILITYFGHVAAFRVQPPTGEPFEVHTHSVVLQNSGRRSATNVRLHHGFLPDFTIWPQPQHTVETLTDGSRDIVIPTLVPGEQVTVSYLYFAPRTFVEVNAGIKCDQGLAQQIPVLLQREYPRSLNVAASVLMLVGLISTVYVIYRGIVTTLR